jgi:hypothetical protein
LPVIGFVSSTSPNVQVDRLRAFYRGLRARSRLDSADEDILKLHPMATYVGGRKVYAAPEANGAF